MPLTTTESLGKKPKPMLCHGCRERVPVIYPDANGKPLCVKCNSKEDAENPLVVVVAD